MPLHRLIRIPLRVLAWSATGVAMLILLGWLVGRVCSDRYPLTQWLLWIPSPALLPTVLVGFLGTIGRGRRPWHQRRLVRFWIVVAALAGIHFTFIEHRLLRRPSDPGAALSVMNWNMTYFEPGRNDDQHVGPLLAMAGDINLLVDARGLRRNEEVLAALPPDATARLIGPVTVMSRLPIIEAREIVASDHGSVVLLQVVGVEGLTRPLAIYVVDLPSDPRLGRSELTKILRTHLDNAGGPAPDLVIGDFNIPRGSASMATLFPEMRHAYDEAGHGYGATFHRGYALYHIDHVLLGEDVDCVRYDLVDPGVGRHLAQKAWIKIRDPAPRRSPSLGR